MTFFGKFLVILNVGLSLMMAAIAFGIYANAIDFSDKPAKDDNPAGILADRIKEVNDLMAALGPARGSWTAARKELLVEEDRRRGVRPWYARELEHLRTGATVASPAREIVYDKGLPKADAANPLHVQMQPAKYRDQNLLSIAHYEEEITRTLGEVVEVMAKHKKAVEEDARLTNVLAGTPDTKGLRKRQDEERAKREGVLAEQQLVRPLFVNAAVESELALKRLQSLQEREKELIEYLRKRHKVEVASRRR
jgi:hypothetical protein